MLKKSSWGRLKGANQYISHWLNLESCSIYCHSVQLIKSLFDSRYNQLFKVALIPFSGITSCLCDLNSAAGFFQGCIKNNLLPGIYVACFFDVPLPLCNSGVSVIYYKAHQGVIAGLEKSDSLCLVLRRSRLILT